MKCKNSYIVQVGCFLLVMVVVFVLLLVVQVGDWVLVLFGVSQVEGVVGGGFSFWVVIGGQGSCDQIGVLVFGMYVCMCGGFELESYGVVVGFYDMVELFFVCQCFGLVDMVLGQLLNMDVVGLKWCVWGDVVYEVDSWKLQVVIGLQYKKNCDMVVLVLLGVKCDSDMEFYIVVVKFWFGVVGGWNLFINVMLCGIWVNQFGLFGFGGDKGDLMKFKLEVLIVVLLCDNLVIGVEYCVKLNQLLVFDEMYVVDFFVVWWLMWNLSIIVVWLDLGQIVNKMGQCSSYVFVQVQFQFSLIQ